VLLAIDTSTGTSVAVVGRTGTRAERTSADTRGHAELIGRFIQEVLDEAGIVPAELEGVAVGMGPGPFTGLRVGIAAARAFALGIGRPVLLVVSHDAAAYGRSEPVLVVTDARRRELAWSRYAAPASDGLPVRIEGPALTPVAEFDTVTSVAGYVRVDAATIDAGRLGLLALARRDAGLETGPAEPVYLRAPDVTLSAPKRALELGAKAISGLRRDASADGRLGRRSPVSGTWTLRRVAASDLDAIDALEQATFPSDAWSRELLAAELAGEHTHYLVAVDDADAVIGYAGLLAPRGGGQGDVQTIAVAASARRRGIGAALLDALLTEAAARGADEVFLEVRADNPGAEALYASRGFARIAVRPAYYQPDGIDAVVMRRIVPNGHQGAS